MATLKAKQIREMGKDERAKKLKELAFELIKAKANVAKSGNAKIREIKKIIARIHTVNSLKTSQKEVLNKK